MAAAAALHLRFALLLRNRNDIHYGPPNGWIALQYWFFLPF